jgi:hypothetical protein
MEEKSGKIGVVDPLEFFSSFLLEWEDELLFLFP